MLKLVAVDWKSQEEVQIGVSLFMHRLKKTNISERQQKNSGLKICKVHGEMSLWKEI